MNISHEKLIDLLAAKWQYPESQVENVAKKIESMATEIQISFEKFAETGDFPAEPEYFGISPASLAENYNFKPPAVFLALDWIKRDPEAALNALVDEFHKPLPASFRADQLLEWKNSHQ